MNQLAVVVSAEFLRRIRSRAYIAATLIGAIGVILVASLPSVLERNIGSNANAIVLIGEPALTAPARPLLAKDLHVVTTLPPRRAPIDLAFLDAHQRAGAAAVLSRSGNGLAVVVYARDPSLYAHTFARDLAPLQLSLATGLSIDEVQRRSTVSVDVRDVGGRFADPLEATTAKGIAYLFVFLLYLAILLNAQSIMASVAEEKTSRIAELLVATIDPARLLAGKVLAAAATGVIQLAIWIAAGGFAGHAIVGVFAENATTAAPQLGPLALPPGEVLALIAFFVVGFLQYAVLYAGAASLINRTEDLGTVAGPLVIPVIIGFVLAQLGLQSPNASSIVVCSQIPLVAPFTMFTRIAVSAVPLWQILLSLAINLAAALAFAVFAGRVYRVGLLLYGRPPSLRQVLATLRA